MRTLCCGTGTGVMGTGWHGYSVHSDGWGWGSVSVPVHYTHQHNSQAISVLCLTTHACSKADIYQVKSIDQVCFVQQVRCSEADMR